MKKKQAEDPKAVDEKAEDPKKTMFGFRLSPEERDRFNRVAEHYNLTAAAMVRMLVKREDDAITNGKRVQKSEVSSVG